MKLGERYKVKATPFLRKYGIDTHGALSRADCKAWPGEIGIVVDSARATGEPAQIMFSRGRAVRLPTIRDAADDLDGYWANKAIEFAADFVKVKTPALASAQQ